MHLTTDQCREDAAACVHAWLFKSTTAFHRHPDWSLPPHFAFFCCSYAVAGVIMLLTRPAWVSATNFPYTVFALVLMFVQAPLSLLADYFHMDHDSIYHVVDRFVAVPSLLLEVWKVMCLWQFGRTSTAAVYSMLTMTAVYCFAQSQHAQSIQDAQGFVTWHNRWHLYPLFASALTLYDVYGIKVVRDTPPQPLLAVIPPLPCCCETAATAPLLLSSVLMLKSSYSSNNNNTRNKPKKEC